MDVTIKPNLRDSIGQPAVHGMNTNESDVRTILSDQCQHQLRLMRNRQLWWLPWIFAIGLCVSAIGMILFVAEFLETRVLRMGGIIYALAAVFFGWVVFLWVRPTALRPRIVPYFARGLGEYAGPTMAAFPRGRRLYQEIHELERLAGRLGVRPLSTFGFAYDYFEQQVHWHPASEGLSTVEALRQILSTDPLTARDLILDLEALASVLAVAAGMETDFSLVLRLFAKENMQAVCTRENRQGSFW